MTDTPLSRRSFLTRSTLAAAAAGVTTVPLVGTVAAAEPNLAGAPGDDGPVALARAWFGADGPGRFDTTHRVFADGSTEVLLWPGDAARLDARGVRYETAELSTLLGPAQARPADLPLQPGEVDAYRTLAQHEADLRALAQAHPHTSRLIELPHITFEGRRVLALEIARDVHADADGRPTLHVDGLHHAREWPAGEMAIMFAVDLLTADGTDPRVTRILDSVRTVVVPVVNPDGFHHSRSAAAETPGGSEALVLGGRGAYWRKNRRSFTDHYAAEGLVSDSGQQTYPAPVRGTDAYGVDPNRNYAYTWGRPGSSANDAHSQSHRGDVPFSEPESRNIAWLMTTRHVTGAMTHHTFAGEIIWPWANEMGEAPDADLYAAIGAQAAALNGYRARKYNTSEGTTADHFYGSTSTLCYLFEHGRQGFHPDYVSTIPAMYAANRDAFLLLAERLCIDTDTHCVLTGRVVDAAGEGVQATLTTRRRYQSPLWLFGDGSTPGGRTVEEEVFEASITTSADGTFTWHLNPSTRPHVLLEGRTESWELAVSTGQAGTVRHLTLDRGTRLDLGDLPVV